MKALFLAGGKGTRLRPLTDRLPKPMVPIMGVPLLRRSFERLKAFGVREIILSTCYKPESIVRCFGDGSRYGLKIRYVREDIPLGTGGAILHAGEWLRDGPFFVLNADILSDIDFGAMARFHRARKAAATLAVTRVEDPSAYGVIESDASGYAVTFKEKPKPGETVSHHINAGVYIFDPAVLQYIPAGRAVSVEREVFPRLLAQGERVATYDGCGYWLDMGTPEKYMRAHRDAFRGLYRLDEADFAKEPVYGRFHAQVSRDAMLRGPIYLGRDVQIAAGAVVGPNAVVGARSRVGRRSRVENAVLWHDVSVQNGVEILDSIVTDGCTVRRGAPCAHRIFTGEDAAGRQPAIS